MARSLCLFSFFSVSTLILSAEQAPPIIHFH
jgi:hypothetical protein